jgi:hypothetical protein
LKGISGSDDNDHDDYVPLTVLLSRQQQQQQQ